MVPPSPLAVFTNIRQKMWKITAGLVSKQAEERCVPHQLFVQSYIRPAKEVISHPPCRLKDKVDH